MKVICHGSGIASVPVWRMTGRECTPATDELAVEAPLEIRLAIAGSTAVSIAVTMRTPGEDAELAVGFLLTEGIIAEPGDVTAIHQSGPNAVEIVLRPGLTPSGERLERHSYISSSCGACGKRSIAAVRVACRHPIAQGTPRVAPGVILGLSQTLRTSQPAFARTGGLHASGLFDTSGRLIALREDVGRHNALDKLIGALWLAGHIPLISSLLLVSGRASFELVQKAAVAGIPILAAVGAPSSLAVELAREVGLTLLGFVRDGRFVIYTDSDRVDLHHSLAHPASEPPNPLSTPGDLEDSQAASESLST